MKFNAAIAADAFIDSVDAIDFVDSIELALVARLDRRDSNCDSRPGGP